jgi:hypothetical protein
MVPVVLLDEPGGHYWSEFERFVARNLLPCGMIDGDDLALYRRTDDVPTAVAEVLQFFRVYHSMRYVRSKLVLRLNERLDDDLVEAINARFADILAAGRFVQGGALPEEKDEPDLAHLPRLVFQFNRRAHGRLRKLIDLLNREAGSEDSGAGSRERDS